jgi:hypothetical protein
MRTITTLILFVLSVHVGCGTKHNRSPKDPQNQQSGLNLVNGAEAFYIAEGGKAPHRNTLVWPNARTSSNVEMTADLRAHPEATAANITSIAVDQLEVSGQACLQDLSGSPTLDTPNTSAIDAYLIVLKGSEQVREIELDPFKKEAIALDFSKYSYKVRLGLNNPGQCQSLQVNMRLKANAAK